MAHCFRIKDYTLLLNKYQSRHILLKEAEII